MSLGFRLPNFPISQIVLAHLGWDYFGNWEIGKYVAVVISQFPNFPNSAELDGLRSFGKVGNWEVHTSTDFPISQFPIPPAFRHFRDKASDVENLHNVGTSVDRVVINSALDPNSNDPIVLFMRAVCSRFTDRRC